MEYSDFLGDVLDPSEGYYCVIGISETGRVKQVFVEDEEDVGIVADKFVERELNVYFGCSKFKTSRSRQAPNSLSLKSFYLDLDCGEDKDYPDQQAAVVALNTFCEAHNLKLPTIVDSGYGLHCYWPLTESIPTDEWKPVAIYLKRLCVKFGFNTDPTATSDESRVLRLPGTKNFKYGTSLPVRMVHRAEPITFEEFKAAINALDAIGLIVPDYAKGSSELTKRLLQDRKNSFEKILKRTAKGDGCAQILHIVTHQNGLHYDMWRGGLSIARNCTDWEVAIHAISQGHDDYDREKTETKAEDTIDKPYKCASFLSLNPKGCEGCPHRGKITSPIQLGVEIEFSKEGESLQEYSVSEGGVWDTEEGEDEDDQEESPVAGVDVVPKLPEGYFRGKHGGIYLVVKDENGEPADAKLVYENDLFVIKRMHDYEAGELVLVRAMLPKDGPTEFVIPLANMSSKEELRKVLASKGVIFMPAQVDVVMKYLIDCTKMQQSSSDAEILRQSMGWVDNDTRFVWGNVEISASSTRYSPPSAATEELSAYMQPKGDFEEWKKIAMIYDKPGFEPHAFAFFSSFGAPLMKFSAYKGAFINLIHPDSGTGKSTILRMICSVFGHPFELLSKEQDTLKHKFHRMGVLNNIAYCCDELTNADPHTTSNLIYGITHGKGAGRMQGSVNAERKNNTAWSTIGVGSANKSMFETLLAHREHVSGEIMRLLEYDISDTGQLSKDEAYEMFDVKLHENYGWAGLPYIQHILSNKDQVLDKIARVQEYIDKSVGFTSKHRFWSAVMARNITGASIAQEAGIINNNVARVLKWVINTLGPQLLDSVQTAGRVDYTGILGQFLNDNINNTLIVNAGKDEISGLPKMAAQDAKHRLLVRMEPDTNNTYILSSAFRSYCTERGLIFKDVINDLKAKGIYIRDIKKRMGAGTKMNTPSVWATQLNYSVAVADDDS